MPGVSSRGVFLSYRREDGASYARLLKSEMRERLPEAHVFMDLDAIQPGQDFTEVIAQAVDSCAVLAVLVGRQWSTLTDEEGRRRLDNPDDYVRFEVRAALERGVLVIPVLIDGARPLRQQDLPSDLIKLARLNAAELSTDRYQYDVERLINVIQQELAAGHDRQEADRQASVEQAHQAPRLASLADRDDGTLDDARARPLIIQDGDQHTRPLIIQAEGQRYTFNTDFTAGRKGSLHVGDEYADDYHARFRAAHNLWYIEDLGSTNGTWLNGRRIQAHQRVKKGDKIRIGQAIVIVEST